MARTKVFFSVGAHKEIDHPAFIGKHKAYGLALAVTAKTALEDDDVCSRDHKAECESSCNPLHGVKVRVCPGNILGI